MPSNPDAPPPAPTDPPPSQWSASWRESDVPADTAPDLEPAPPAPSPPPPARTSLVAVALAAFAGAVGGGIVAAAIVTFLVSDDHGATSSSTPGQETTVRVEERSAITDVAAKVRPSVVKIQSRHRVQGGVAEDIGSGIVLDNEGHILTNAHVVLGTDALVVTFADGSERPAILIGHDSPFTDVAVLLVSPGQLAPVEVGDSAALALGQTVVALGNPLGDFEGSVTVGVVSGLHRVRALDNVVQDDLIQTDAAINNGNSGGALLNLQGQFVGIPTITLRESRDGQPVEGISFALPSNRLMEIARGIIAANGSYPRPAMGIDHADIDDEILARFPRLSGVEGALVLAVSGSGPAADAGIAPGDVVVKVGDTAVDRDHLFLNAMMNYKAGDNVRVVLNRNGRIIEVDVRLGQRS